MPPVKINQPTARPVIFFLTYSVASLGESGLMFVSPFINLILFRTMLLFFDWFVIIKSIGRKPLLLILSLSKNFLPSSFVIIGYAQTFTSFAPIAHFDLFWIVDRSGVTVV